MIYCLQVFSLSGYSEFQIILKRVSVNFQLFSFETDGCHYIPLKNMDDILVHKKLVVFGRKLKI